MPKLASGCCLLVLAIAETACSSARTEWAGTVVDSAGVTVVSNPAKGTWTTASAWKIEEETRIGANEGDPNYQFGQIGSIAIDSDGQLFVLDAQARNVRVFTSDGRYLRTIGGPGNGPGELGAGALFVLLGPGDTLFVPDLQNRRMNRYAPDGSSQGSFPLEIERGLPLAFRGTASGLIAEQIRPFGLPNRPTADSMDVIVALRPNGSTDTLMQFLSGRTINLGSDVPEINLYSPEAVWDITDDEQLLFAVNDQYRIGIYSRDGVLERLITKPLRKRKVGDRDQQAVMNFMEKTWKDAGIPPQVLPRLRDMVHFGEFFPAFAAVAAGPQQTIWVQHIQVASDLGDEELENYNLLEQTGGAEWDVFDKDGRLLGVVSMPPRFAPRLFRNNKIYGVWRDEVDVQYVMRVGVLRPDEEDAGTGPQGEAE
ncbi:MAG: 6-bladed beta-propeller [Gemmatimonadales bacterium]